MEHKQGILLIDKPTAMTSHDVVNIIRKITNTKTVGHAGTLDPLATGLLILLVGKSATKKSPYFLHMDKTYEVDMLLGIETDSGDIDGQITNQLTPSDTILKLTPNLITSTLQMFVGSYLQQVPLFSAVKIAGRKLYQHGRKHRTQPNVAINIERPSRQITIHTIEFNRMFNDEAGYPHIVFTTHVSSGTYTRSLITDIATRLNIPATQAGLRRTQIGPFSLDLAHPIKTVTQNDIIPLAKLALNEPMAPSSNG